MTILETAACLSIFMRTARILMSSCSSWPYSFLPATQRLSHVRLMPRRRPIGLTFCPIVLSSGLRFDFADDDRQVREWLLDPTCPAAGASVETLHDERLTHESLGDDEIV